MESDNVKQLRKRLEIGNTVILAVATLSITWCSYQSTLWNGIQTFNLAESSRFFGRAQQQTLIAAEKQNMEVAIAINFMNAVIEGDTKQVEFYTRKGNDQIKSLLRNWLSTQPLKDNNAPPHPLAMPEYAQYQHTLATNADSLANTGGHLWRQAETANHHSDNYVLLNVILSMAMFLGAISTKLANVRLTFILISIAAIICGALLVVMLFIMPVAGS
jgi:hypothetical protein